MSELTKLRDAFQDDAFVETLADTVSPEDAQKAFMDKGVYLGMREIKDLGAQIKERLGDMDQPPAKEAPDLRELSDEELEQVAGGWIGTAIMIALTAATAIYSVVKMNQTPAAQKGKSTSFGGEW